MSWFWRTKPRSIIKTIQWFPYFAALKGKNWDEKASYLNRFGKPVHPARREYIYSAHSDGDTWLSSIPFEEYLLAEKDQKETESNGRNDKTTFEFFGFGYVDAKGKICVTEVGNKIVQGTFDSEDYLKQLLKLRLPNMTARTKDKGSDAGIFPFQLILTAFQHFESLNRSELVLLFGCAREADTGLAVEAVGQFKSEYEKLENKNDTGRVKELCKSLFIKYYGELPNDIGSYYDYAEALSRTLVYTGLFTWSGRSIASKIRVAEHSAAKVRMLQEKYTFILPDHFLDVDDYMDWYGSARNVILPWENVEERKKLIEDKADLLVEKIKEAGPAYEEAAQLSFDDIYEIRELAKNNSDAGDLKQFENKISQAIVSHNEERFKRVLSKEGKARREILDKFDEILDNVDMSALWLEVNTWKSLIAVEGDHQVKRNFKIEEDLTPRSFAPGVGNTPDMELYGNGYILIPEVSLMTGVRQWEHEASSVIDHVLGFIKKYEGQKVTGLFLSSGLNERTIWQFFILNRESWMGKPVPVVPMTIKQYMGIIGFIYERNLNIEDFMGLLWNMSDAAFDCGNFKEWKSRLETTIEAWKASYVSAA